MQLLKFAIEEQHRLENMLEMIRNELKTSPDGHLKCKINRGNIQYYCGNKYLNKKSHDLAAALAQKDYLESIKAAAEHNLSILKRFIAGYQKDIFSDIYKKLHSGRKAFVKPLVLPIEDIVSLWETEEYVPGSFDENDRTEYYTRKGERVRSKSEKIIADELFDAGIPYKYEKPLYLNDWNKIKQFRPDFTVLNRSSGRCYYIEHFGMMDNISYYNNALSKLDIYEKNDLLIGRDIVIFHETSAAPLNIKTVRHYIHEYLL